MRILKRKTHYLIRLQLYSFLKKAIRALQLCITVNGKKKSE
jgi:hypothetical protein